MAKKATKQNKQNKTKPSKEEINKVIQNALRTELRDENWYSTKTKKKNKKNKPKTSSIQNKPTIKPIKTTDKKTVPNKIGEKKADSKKTIVKKTAIDPKTNKKQAQLSKVKPKKKKSKIVKKVRQHHVKNPPIADVLASVNNTIALPTKYLIFPTDISAATKNPGDYNGKVVFSLKSRVGDFFRSKAKYVDGTKGIQLRIKKDLVPATLENHSDELILSCNGPREFMTSFLREIADTNIGIKVLYSAKNNTFVLSIYHKRAVNPSKNSYDKLYAKPSSKSRIQSKSASKYEPHTLQNCDGSEFSLDRYFG